MGRKWVVVGVFLAVLVAVFAAGVLVAFLVVGPDDSDAGAATSTTGAVIPPSDVGGALDDAPDGDGPAVELFLASPEGIPVAEAMGAASSERQGLSCDAGVLSAVGAEPYAEAMGAVPDPALVEVTVALSGVARDITVACEADTTVPDDLVVQWAATVDVFFARLDQLGVE